MKTHKVGAEGEKGGKLGLSTYFGRKLVKPDVECDEGKLSAARDVRLQLGQEGCGVHSDLLVVLLLVACLLFAFAFAFAFGDVVFHSLNTVCENDHFIFSFSHFFHSTISFSHFIPFLCFSLCFVRCVFVSFHSVSFRLHSPAKARDSAQPSSTESTQTMDPSKVPTSAPNGYVISAEIIEDPITFEAMVRLFLSPSLSSSQSQGKEMEVTLSSSVVGVNRC